MNKLETTNESLKRPEDTNIRIKRTVYRKLKVFAAIKGMSLSDLIEYLLKEIKK